MPWSCLWIARVKVETGIAKRLLKYLLGMKRAAKSSAGEASKCPLLGDRGHFENEVSGSFSKRFAQLRFFNSLLRGFRPDHEEEPAENMSRAYDINLSQSNDYVDRATMNPRLKSRQTKKSANSIRNELTPIKRQLE